MKKLALAIVVAGIAILGSHMTILRNCTQTIMAGIILAIMLAIPLAFWFVAREKEIIPDKGNYSFVVLIINLLTTIVGWIYMLMTVNWFPATTAYVGFQYFFSGLLWLACLHRYELPPQPKKLRGATSDYDDIWHHQ